MSPSKTDIAWLAGFFDGEGSVGIYGQFSKPSNKRPVYNTRVRIATADLLAMQEVVRISGFGKLHVELAKDYPGRNKNIYSWNLFTQPQAVRFLKMVIPYLRAKRDQSEMVVAWCALPKKQKVEIAPLVSEQLKKMKKGIEADLSVRLRLL